MTALVLDLGLTALLGLGFSALGSLLVRPRRADACAWSTCFLAGAATCAALLFPLSLVFPGRGLTAAAVLPGAAVAVVLGRRLRRSTTPRAPRQGERDRRRLASLALLAAIAAAAVAFAVLDLRQRLLWDGFQIWSSKAHVLVVAGGLDRSWYPEDGYDRRLLAYPPLVPMMEALLARLRGGFDFDGMKPVFLLFYGSLLASTYGAARSRLSERAALVTTLVVALLPELSSGSAAGGYADMPQAAVVAATVAAAFRKEDARALPWMIGALTVVKSEGLLLAAIACAAVGAFWASQGLRRARALVLEHRRGIAVAGTFVAIRFAHLAWLALDDLSFRNLGEPGSLAETQRRLLHVGRICVEAMLDVSRWGVLWPAFAAAGLYLLLRGDRRERCLAAAVGLGLAGVSAIFLQTNWSVELHVAQAMPRLLAQLAPAAVLAVMFAAGRARTESSGPAYDRREAW